jgi:hypothetical protein
MIRPSPVDVAECCHAVLAVPRVRKETVASRRPGKTTSMGNSVFANPYPLSHGVAAHEFADRPAAGSLSIARNRILAGNPLGLFQFGKIPDADQRLEGKPTVHLRWLGKRSACDRISIRLRIRELELILA